MEVGQEAVCYLEFVGRENELVGPAGGRLDSVFRGGGTLHGPNDGGAHGADALAVGFGLVDGVCRLRINPKLFRIHLVLGQVLYFYVSEGAQPNVHGHFGQVYALDFQALQHVFTEVQGGNGGGNGAFYLRKNALVSVRVLGLQRTLNVLGDGGFCFSQFQSTPSPRSSDGIGLNY